MTTVHGAEVVPKRMEWARSLDLFDEVLDSTVEPLERIHELTGGTGVEAAVDCSGHHAARSLALKALRVRGRLALVGEGGRKTLDVVPHAIDPRSARRLWETSEELITA